MRQTNDKLALLILLAFLAPLAGCYGIDVQMHETPLSALKFAAHSRPVDIYMGNILPQRRYLQLAFLEVVGNDASNTSSLLALLKDKARALGAQAIIGINKTYKGRTMGNAGVDILNIAGCVADSKNCSTSPKDLQIDYSAPVLSGIAIRYEDINDSLPRPAAVSSNKTPQLVEQDVLAIIGIDPLTSGFSPELIAELDSYLISELEKDKSKTLRPAKQFCENNAKYAADCRLQKCEEQNCRTRLGAVLGAKKIAAATLSRDDQKNCTLHLAYYEAGNFAPLLDSQTSNNCQAQSIKLAIAQFAREAKKASQK